MNLWYYYEKNAGDDMKKLKFYLITDTHFFLNSLGAYGEEYEKYMTTQQKCFAETEAINKAVFEWLEGANEADIVLIAGDLTFNGERESHEEFSKMLKKLKDSGKKIYVVTAAHDRHSKPFCYRGDKREYLENTGFEELISYYHEFGYDEAISFNKEHLSYVAQLNDEVRLLVLCNDSDTSHSLEYDDDFYKWIKDQCKKAQEDNMLMIAMEHYPVIAGQPIFRFIGDARQKGASKLIETLADNGVHLIFTGHMHNQSINLSVTKNGNKFYDVCTGSVIAYPNYIRLCTVIDKETIDIKSIKCPDFEWDTNGKTCDEYLINLFEKMIRGYVIGLKDNPAGTLDKIGVETKNKIILNLAKKFGAFVSDCTCKKMCKILCIRCEDEIKDVKFVDIAVNLVKYTFRGNQPYTDQTPEGRMLLKIFERIAKIIKLLKIEIKDSQGEKVDIFEVLKNTAGNYDISDYDAVLKLK